MDSALEKIDMSLDDIIKATRNNGKKSAFNPRGRGVAKFNPGGKWTHDKYDNTNNSRRAPFESGARVSGRVFDAPRNPLDRSEPSERNGKLLVSNLPDNVTTEDLNDLLNGYQYTKIERLTDREGRFRNSAHITTKTYGESIKIMKEFAGIALDNKPLQISDLMSDEDTRGRGSILDRVTMKSTDSSRYGSRKEHGHTITKAPRHNSAPKPRFAKNNNTSKRSSGPKRNEPKVTPQDLDAELEAYMSKKSEGQVESMEV
uniref:RRM domain-containing protein n=1 Tax=Rhabditophanes sp. KR3021 TaxID=114890 RepID=A0AC35TKX6_9BILA